jgi:molybdate transport system substrate-binding protein
VIIRNQRSGSTTRPFLLVVAGIVLLGGLGIMLLRMDRATTTKTRSLDETDEKSVAPLMLYCASALRAPIERIVADYQSAYGVEVQIQFGGSNTLLSQIEIARTGDLFLAADHSYLELARKKGLLAETLPLATMRAVMIVPRANPRKLSGLADLLRTDVRTALGNPDQAAIGHVVRNVIQSSGHWKELEKCITDRGVFQPAVAEVANSVKLGAVDAGIVWNTVATGDSSLTVISPPEFAAATAQVALGVLKCSTQPTAALRFAQYIADRGLAVFKEFGYQVIDGK